MAKREALAVNRGLKVLVAHGMTDLVTPYFASKYVIERLPPAAVALARTAGQVVDLTYRQAYSSGASGTWSNLKDGAAYDGTTRRWGVDDWAIRGWQGAYFNWMTGNSMLPSVDPDSSHQGIQKIDRTTVPELSQLITQATAIQIGTSTPGGSEQFITRWVIYNCLLRYSIHR
mgnify:CR=1 FL=1